MTRDRFLITRGARIAVALAAAGLATLSCSVLIDTSSKQCTVDADCPKLGAAFANAVCQKNICVHQCEVDADCVKQDDASATSICQSNVCVAPVEDPLVCKTVPPNATSMVTLTFTIGFASKPSSGALGKFTVLACNRLDVDCTSPVAGPEVEDPSDSTSQISLTLPYGFQGFLQILNHDDASNMDVTVPSMEFLARPIQKDTAGWNLTLATPATVAGLGFATGTSIDDKLGTFIVLARDCDRTPLAGVKTAIDVTQGDVVDAGPDTTVGFYLVNTFPTKSQMVTTSEGASGYVNVPIGSASLSGTIVDRMFALSPTAAVSRGGWISYVELQP